MGWKWCSAVVGVLALAAQPAAALSPINKSLIGGIAIKGYDPVAYFTLSQPARGKKEHAFEWQGAVWQFASAENRSLFAADPERYAPQFGGYCAYGVARGYTVGIDPEAWAVRDGKLYLNYGHELQEKWLADPDAYIAQAEANWPRLLQE